MKSPVTRSIAVIGLAIAVGAVLLLAPASFSGRAQDHRLGETPSPTADGAATAVASPGAVANCTPDPSLAPEVTPDPDAMATPEVQTGLVADLDISIEGWPEAETEVGYPYRLYTRVVEPGREIEMRCRQGFNLIYVLSGTVELTVGEGGGIVEVGALGDDRLVILRDPADPANVQELACTLECELTPGMSMTLVAGDTVFTEEAVFGLVNVGFYDALLLVAAQAPTELPCSSHSC